MKTLQGLLIVICVQIYGCLGIGFSKLLADREMLIVVAFDGYRADYLHRNITPNMLNFRLNGVYADYIKSMWSPEPQFSPSGSLTTYGHWGFEADKQHKLDYNNAIYREDPKKLIPIWILNQRHRKGKSLCMMWPGGELRYGEHHERCSIVVEYDEKEPLTDRVDHIIDWLNDVSNRPNLVMFYVEEPERSVKIYGEDSQQVQTKIGELDRVILDLQWKLEKIGLRYLANIVLLSDYAIHPIPPYSKSCPHQLPIPIPIPITNHPFFLNRTSLADVNARKAAVRFQFGALQINFDKDDPEPGCGTIFEFKFKDYFQHDYCKDAFFMARGPMIAVNKKVPPFEMADMYGFLAKLLSINATRHGVIENGNMTRVMPVFKAVYNKYIFIAAIICLLTCLIGYAHLMTSNDSRMAAKRAIKIREDLIAQYRAAAAADGIQLLN